MPSFLDRLNSQIVRKARDLQETMGGTIVSVNADGTYDVSVKGNSGVFKEVAYLQNFTLHVGDYVLMDFLDGDRQRPVIMLPGDSVATANPLVFDLAAGLDWAENIGPQFTSAGIHRSVQKENTFTLKSTSLYAIQDFANTLTGSILPNTIFFTESNPTFSVSAYTFTGNSGGSATMNPSASATQPIFSFENFSAAEAPGKFAVDSTGIYLASNDEFGFDITIQKYSVKDGSQQWSITIPYPSNAFVQDMAMFRQGNFLSVFVTYSAIYTPAPAIVLPIQFPQDMLAANGTVFGQYNAFLANVSISDGTYAPFTTFTLSHGENAQDTYSTFVPNKIGFDGNSFFNTVWQFDLTGFYVLLNPVLPVPPPGGGDQYYPRWVLLSKDFPFSNTTTISVSDIGGTFNRTGVLYNYDSNNNFLFYSDIFYKNAGGSSGYGGIFFAPGGTNNVSTFMASQNLLVNPAWFENTGPSGGGVAPMFLPMIVPVGNWRLVKVTAFSNNSSIIAFDLITLGADPSGNPLFPGRVWEPLATFQTAPGEKIQTNFDGNPFPTPSVFANNTINDLQSTANLSAYENRSNQSVTLFNPASFQTLNPGASSNNFIADGSPPNVSARSQTFNTNTFYAGYLFAPTQTNAVQIYGPSFTNPNIISLDFCGPGVVIDINNNQALSISDLSQVLWQQISFVWFWVCWMTDTKICVCNNTDLWVLNIKDGTIAFHKTYHRFNLFNNGLFVNGGGNASIVGGDGSFVVAAQDPSNVNNLDLEQYT
jgi:hypothetical protein